jgi:hypothetical protein
LKRGSVKQEVPQAVVKNIYSRYMAQFKDFYRKEFFELLGADSA